MLQVPEAAFTDPDLQTATPDETALGLPKVITGAFAAVFPMTLESGRRVAVKCFLREVRDRRERYRAVSRHLGSADLPYTVGFDYQPEGIEVDGQALPMLRMEWAEGQTLNAFVAGHLDAPNVLATLSEHFTDMLATLQDNGIAHGDLQHGNVLVAESDNGLALRLVDYDTTYVPALSNRPSTEIGHRNYQHPNRDEHDFGPHLDHFAGRVIHTALQALRRRPALWERFDTGENLLFRADDFYAPDESPLFDALMQTEAVRPLAEALRTACYLEPEDLPPPTEGVSAAAAPRTPRERPAESTASRRSWAERLFLPVLVGCLASCMLMVVAGFELLGASALLLTLCAAGVAAWRVYRRLPVARRRKRLRSEVAYFERLLHDLQRQIETREQQRHDVQANVDALRAERLEELQQEALRDRLKYHFVNEAKAVEGIGHHVVVRLKAAGIRAAHQLDPERLADVRRIGDRSRARVRMWRASLAREYEDDVPDHLSPAEERRLRRSVERRAHSFTEAIERLRAKMQVQTQEKEAVGKRLDRLPRLTFGRYLAYLLRLRKEKSPASGVKAKP